MVAAEPPPPSQPRARPSAQRLRAPSRLSGLQGGSASFMSLAPVAGGSHAGLSVSPIAQVTAAQV